MELPELNGYIFEEAKYMIFMLGNKQNRVLGKCNEIWNKVDGVIKKRFSLWTSIHW